MKGYNFLRGLRSIMSDRMFVETMRQSSYSHLLASHVSYHASHHAMKIIDAMYDKYLLTNYNNDFKPGAHFIEVVRK